MKGGQMSLLPPCPLAGCDQLTVDPRVPCPDCLAAFGDMIRPSDTPVSVEEFTAASAAGDARVALVTAKRAVAAGKPAAYPGEVPNQTCWCCDQRRTCHPDPCHPERMICRACEEIL